MGTWIDVLQRRIRMLRIIPGWRQRCGQSRSRRAKTQRVRFDRPWRRLRFAVFEDRAVLSVTHDLQNEIAPYRTAIDPALGVATSRPLAGHQFDRLQALNTLLQHSLQGSDAKFGCRSRLFDL
jgi:hypothetical protein